MVYDSTITTYVFQPRFAHKLRLTAHLRAQLSPTPKEEGPSIFARLPDELVHYTMKLAATSCPKTCRQLCATSFWARIFFLSYALPELSLDMNVDIEHVLNYPDYPSYIRYTRDCEWVSYLNFTKKLRISRIPGLYDVETLLPSVLSHLPNLHSITLGVDYFLALARITDIRTYLCNTDLDFTILDGPLKDWNPFTRGVRTPLFEQISKLHLTHISTHSHISNPSHIALDLTPYSKLTHLAIDYRVPDTFQLDTLVGFVERVKTIEMVVIVDKCGVDEQKSILASLKHHRQTDRRFFFFHPKRNRNFPKESLWELAITYTEENIDV